ncbi:MAG TPA: hypothetical protein VLI69_02985 [Gammaproteobacteria bacterium]|nr:hypothetical protein [Gammaproteobacteria bacterium]
MDNKADFYQAKELVINATEENNVGSITELDKLLAAKQILCGIAFIYIFTVFAFLIYPASGGVLLEICKTVLPPLATLIIAFYFKDKAS